MQVVISEGEVEGASRGCEDVVGDHGGELVGYVSYVGEDGIALLAGGDVEHVRLEHFVMVAFIIVFGRGCIAIIATVVVVVANCG